MARVVWISTQEFAAIAGLTDRSARRIAQAAVGGKMWRDTPLAARIVEGRGGSSGQSYQVLLSSLPTDLMPTAPKAPQPIIIAPPQDGPRRRLGRRDRGQPRHIITRTIDKVLLGYTDPAHLAEIGRQVHHYVKRAWASELQRSGWRKVAVAGSYYLHDLCRKLGMPEAEVRRLELTRHYVEDFDRRKHRNTDIYLNDKKTFNDRMPRVSRDPSLLDRPLEVVIGDGTALDVRWLRPDGSEIKVWLIIWMDWLTGRLFGHAYPRPKSEGVRQEHIVYSFAVLASQHGLPENVYLDNGSEYGALDRLEELGVRRITALPYNAPAKPVEAAISVLVKQHISLIPGYIGSDRMRKKSQSVGQPTKPFAGGKDELFAAIGMAFDSYNATPRRRLGGVSSNEVWTRHLDSGWAGNKAGIATIFHGLAKTKRHKVLKGRVHVRGCYHTCEALKDYGLEGATVVVSVPVHGDLPPAVYDPKGRYVGLVHPIESRHPLDIAGAQEAGRNRTLRNRSARALKDDAPPLDIAPFQNAFNALTPPPEERETSELLEFADERFLAVQETEGKPVKNTRQTGFRAIIDETPDKFSFGSASKSPTVIGRKR